MPAAAYCLGHIGHVSSGMLTKIVPFFLVNILGVQLADHIGKGVRTAPRDARIANSIDRTQVHGPGLPQVPHFFSVL